MHMTMVMGAGVLLLVVFVMFGWLWDAGAAGMTEAAKLFVPVVFAVPAVVAAIVAWQLSRG